LTEVKLTFRGYEKVRWMEEFQEFSWETEKPKENNALFPQWQKEVRVVSHA
jgi:hypothetical protein